MKSLFHDIKGEWPYYALILLVFYVLPHVVIDTGSGMFMLLFVMPLIVFLTSFVYGIRRGFHLRYALIVALSFIPSIYLIYNDSAWIYTLIFGCLALFGNVLALIFRTK